MSSRTEPALRRLRPEDWRLWRDTRLAALAEAPHAFGSSLSTEQQQGDDDWRAWVDPARGLKVVAGSDAGLVGAWRPPSRPGAVELFSMWVHPAWRGRGVGGLLIDEVVDWAGGARIDLWVADGNAVAERLYERHGFRKTGETQPHPGHPGVLEHVMTRA